MIYFEIGFVVKVIILILSNLLQKNYIIPIPHFKCLTNLKSFKVLLT